MQKYYNNVISSTGKPVQGASISVVNYPANTTATIYSDNGVTPTTNPLTSDVNGAFSFYAADGRYTLSVSANGQVQQQFIDVLLEDPTMASPLAATTLDVNNTLNLSGTAQRITGDFSNATIANRVFFQTSTVNGASVVGAIPNGTSTIAQLAAYGGSDPNNAQVIRVDTRGGSDSRIESTFAGTPVSGTYLPMTFYTGGSERMRIDTSGNQIINPQITPPTLATNGQMVFNLTSNTNLRISVRGSDGVTRVANITLA
jgi:hypothetical protein